MRYGRCSTSRTWTSRRTAASPTANCWTGWARSPRCCGERHTHGDVLVVGHGAAFRALAVRLLRLPDEAFWSLSGLRSASISRVRRRDDGRTALFAWSDAGHLESLLPAVSAR